MTAADVVEQLDGIKKHLFLTIEDRQKLALQRHQEEAGAQQKRRAEVAATKEQYLGSHKKPKMRVIIPREKFRFSIDWDTTEEEVAQQKRRDIEEQYLGSNKKPKMMVIMPCEKFRFSIDWENIEEEIAQQERRAELEGGSPLAGEEACLRI